MAWLPSASSLGYKCLLVSKAHPHDDVFFFCRDTTIINHSPCHSSNNSFNEDLPVADYRNQEMENRCVSFHEMSRFFFGNHFGECCQSSPFPSLFWIRIRALYAQILEKDAVIKILNQRLHHDQGRRDEQSPHANLLNKAASSLRPATSTPSISSPTTTTATTKTRGEALGPSPSELSSREDGRVTLPISSSS